MKENLHKIKNNSSRYSFTYENKKLYVSTNTRGFNIGTVIDLDELTKEQKNFFRWLFTEELIDKE